MLSTVLVYTSNFYSRKGSAAKILFIKIILDIGTLPVLCKVLVKQSALILLLHSLRPVSDANFSRAKLINPNKIYIETEDWGNL